MTQRDRWICATTRRAVRSESVRENVIDEVPVPLQIDSMPASKDNIKAFFIIAFYLALLVGLLAFANHVRPHP